MPTHTFTLPAQKRIALVAHDNMKATLLRWAERHKKDLKNHRLCATGTTGKLLKERLELEVEPLLSGPLGGDQQIGARIAEQRLDMLLFFWDPLAAQPHDPDVKALLRIAAVANIPVACNEASADFLCSSPFLNQQYEGQRPDHQDHLLRPVPALS